MSKLGVEPATAKGVLFLRSAQSKDGSFGSFSSPSRSPFKAEGSYKTIFTPAIILAALSQVPGAAEIRHKLAGWLLAQKSDQWSFNYWAKNAEERVSLPYPDDLDDTFCVLIALYQHQPELIDGAVLGKIVRLLVATEASVGGPYRTWLVESDAPKIWQDVDLAVNSNIAYFLRLVAEPLPNLTATMEAAIKSGDLSSPYYPSPYPLAYYLARAYRGDQQPKLAEYLLGRQRGGWWGNPLHTALAVSALAQLDHQTSCTAAVQRLMKAQLPDGSWPAEAFCLDPAKQGKPYYSGAPALTTALVLEALARYAATAITTPPGKPNTRDKTVASLQARIAGRAGDELRTLPPTVRKTGQSTLAAILNDHHGPEIVLLPYLFNQSLIKPVRPPATDFFEQLGLANLFGWAAYTIFDDFLDDEGRPLRLPFATIALRRSWQHFRQALPADDFQRLVERTFDTIDAANAWEVANCRFGLQAGSIIIDKLPRFGKRQPLAERSLGHTLTPLAVLAAGGAKLNNPAVIHIQQALEQYLIARQLNDDLHDWEDDLRAGRATYVVSEILRDLTITSGKPRLEQLLPAMQRQFWHHTVTRLCHTITGHTAQARRLAAASQLLTEDNLVTKLSGGIDGIVEQTLKEQTNAKQFLAAYRA